jgi:hypothetical protein
MGVAGSKDTAARGEGASTWAGSASAAPAGLELPRNTSAEPAFDPEPGSYRDRNSAVFYYNGEVFRGISAKALANWKRLTATRFFQDFTARGSIVPTEMVSEPTWGMPSQAWANGPSGC